VLTDVYHESKTNNNKKPIGTQCCGSKRCKTCPLINTDAVFKSSYTNKTYKVSKGGNLTCKTSNVIYLITCKRCGFQYVGETQCTLRDRFNGHRGSILGKRKKNTYLALHFRQNGHTYSDLSVQIIENLVSTDEDRLDKDLRLQREKYWMTELCTVFPFGLNDKVRGIGNVSQTSTQIHSGMLFNKHSRKKRSHGHRKNNKASIHKITVRDLDKMVNNDNLCLHQVKCSLYALPLSVLHKINDDASDQFFSNQISDITYHLITEISYCRLFKPVLSISNPPKRYFMKMEYNNKGIDTINITNILHNKAVRKCIPPYFQNTEVPIISYKYTPTIYKHIVNYNEVIKEIDTNSAYSQTYCECESSPYNYKPHGHIITGNLNIIQNKDLRNLIKKGPKYRERNPINWSKNKSIIFKAIEKYANKWCKLEKADSCALDEWLNSIKDIVNSKIKRLSKRPYIQPHKILEDTSVQQYLSTFKERFVLVPADKASNNIIIVCKKFYIETLLKELGITTCTTNDTYQQVPSKVEDIVLSHIKHLSEHGIHIPDTCHDLPKLYWTPKMHKTPYKARFIAGSRTCTTKTLSSMLTKCFQTIKEQQIRYSYAIYKTLVLTECGQEYSIPLLSTHWRKHM